MEETLQQNGYKIAKALGIALDAHRDQVDKAGKPYIYHILGVARSATTEDECIVALLHDYVEDGKLATRSEYLAHVKEIFGEKIFGAIDAISKKPKETREKYITRVAKNPLATRVKYYDIENNMNPVRMALLDAKTISRLQEKYTTDYKLLVELNKKTEAEPVTKYYMIPQKKLVGKIIGVAAYRYDTEKGWITDKGPDFLTDYLCGYDWDEPDDSPYKTFNSSIMDAIEEIPKERAERLIKGEDPWPKPKPHTEVY